MNGMWQLLLVEIFLLPEEYEFIPDIEETIIDMSKQNLASCTFFQFPYNGWKWLNKLIFFVVICISCYTELCCLLIFFLGAHAKTK